MPHINSVGSVCHGVGGGNVHINNAVVAAGAVMGWMDDGRVAFANGSDAYLVSQYVVASTAISRLSPVASMNTGYAGGGAAAWWYGAPAGTPGGLFSTTPLRLPSAGLLGMGPDGSIGYKPNYHSGGPTRVRELSGADWMLTPNHAYSLQLLGGRRAIWIDSVNGLSVYGLPTPSTYASPTFPYAFLIDGLWWIGYQTGAQGTLAHPFSAPNLDHVLVAAGTPAWPAFRALTNNSFRFAWSSTEAEQAGHLTISTVTISGAPAGPGEVLPPDPGGSTGVPPDPGVAAPRATVYPRQALHRQYPHVDAITDWRAQQTTRLLWDRVFDLEERLQSSEATAGDLVPISNSQDDYLASLSAVSGEALSIAQFTRRQQELIAAGTRLPGEAPYMMATLEARLAAGPPGGGTWDLTVLFGATGQSKFIEAAVDDLHAIDPRWGHLHKTGGQNGSVESGGDGHAVDAINWQNPDGVTAEIYDVISSSGSLVWNYDTGSRSNSNALDNWKYPVGAAPGGGGAAGSSSANPIIAMSSVPANIEASVAASMAWYVTNLGSVSNPSASYWVGLASSPEVFSNGKWHLGWNKYWEDRMHPANTGSADPAGGALPAVHT